METNSNFKKLFWNDPPHKIFQLSKEFIYLDYCYIQTLFGHLRHAKNFCGMHIKEVLPSDAAAQIQDLITYTVKYRIPAIATIELKINEKDISALVRIHPLTNSVLAIVNDEPSTNIDSLNKNAATSRDGNGSFLPEQQEKLKEHLGLSLKEQEIIHWIGEGKTNWEIGQIIGSNERMIKYYVKEIFSKLRISKRSQIKLEVYNLVASTVLH